MLSDVWDAWLPPEPQRAVDWIPANIVIPSTTETGGPFDVDAVPHVLRVLELIDDPFVRRIVLVWATRNAKTYTTLSVLAFLAVTTGRPAMICSSNEDRADDTIQNQFYPLLEESDVTRPLLLDERKRNSKSIILGKSRIRKAYSGSPSTLAGFPACYGVANELSKWSTKKSSEASPVRLFGERAKLFPFDSKLIYESTPGEVGHCQITALARAATTRVEHRLVPCPVCGTFQKLEWGDGRADTHGVKWRKPEGSKRSDPLLAEETAYYRCLKGCTITDADRPEMLRAGQWVADGVTIDRRGRRRGTPTVDSSTVALDELSTLYSTLISGWGQLVREWLEVQGDREGIRNFVNSTLAKAFDPAPQRVEPHELAARLAGESVRGVCPEWAAFLVLAADVGAYGSDDFAFYWMAVAFGPARSSAPGRDEADLNLDVPGRRGQVIDWGIAEGKAAFVDLLPAVHYDHAAGGTLDWAIGGVDTGWQGRGTEDTAIYQLCDSVRNLYPLKADSARGRAGDWYRWGLKRADATQRELSAKRRHGVGDLFLVSTPRSQSWRDNLVSGKTRPADEEWCGLPADVCAQHERYGGLFEELMADTLVEGKWERFGRPNEYGDTLRYARALAELYVQTAGGKSWETLARHGSQPAGPRESYFARQKQQRRPK